MNREEIITHLSKKENWTEILEYVHRTRLILGFVLGILTGFILGW